jgi:hypothetical protein
MTKLKKWATSLSGEMLAIFVITMVLLFFVSLTEGTLPTFFGLFGSGVVGCGLVALAIPDPDEPGEFIDSEDIAPDYFDIETDDELVEAELYLKVEYSPALLDLAQLKFQGQNTVSGVTEYSVINELTVIGSLFIYEE